MPVSHGYRASVRRSIRDRLGLYGEIEFDEGHSEDNELSHRARMAGTFEVCPTDVVMVLADLTNFGDGAEGWTMRGRQALRDDSRVTSTRFACSSTGGTRSPNIAT